MPYASGADWKVETIGSGGASSFPAAAPLADNTANPTTTTVGAMCHWWDGAAWDRAPGTSAGGAVVSAGTGTNAIDGGVASDYVGPSTATGAALRGWNTTLSVLNTAGTFNRVKEANAADNLPGVGLLGVGVLLYDGTNWQREPINTGTQANAWTATALTDPGVSTALDARFYSEISFFGRATSVTGTWRIIIQMSQDNVNWYDLAGSAGEITSSITGDSDFAKNVTIGARYVRMKALEDAAGGITLTATIAGKR